MNINEDLKNSITNALPEDPDIGPYLQQLHNPALPRDDKAQEYLEPFSVVDKVVLYNGLVYVPKSDNIKLQIL
jgi:hypothetical protein